LLRDRDPLRRKGLGREKEEENGKKRGESALQGQL